MEKTIEELIYEETDKRLTQMNDPAYRFPEKISKNDIFGIVAMIAGSMVLISLCMLGVIA